MRETTFWPRGSLSGSVVSAISPVQSMPKILGKVTEGEGPCLVKISEWLRPKARMRMSDRRGAPEAPGPLQG